VRPKIVDCIDDGCRAQGDIARARRILDLLRQRSGVVDAIEVFRAF
jgi:hypothetical protein